MWNWNWPNGMTPRLPITANVLINSLSHKYKYNKGIVRLVSQLTFCGAGYRRMLEIHLLKVAFIGKNYYYRSNLLLDFFT